MLDIAKDLENLRKKLVDTGARNKLIHINRDNKRGPSIKIVNERSDDIFKILKKDSKKMRFKADPNADKYQELDSDINLAIDDEDNIGEKRYTDNFLETKLDSDTLQKKLLQISRTDKTITEETGAKTLYLAMGFISWYEAEQSDKKRESPLILLPVELVRNNKGTFNINCRGDDIINNLSLYERFKGDFGIKLPEIDDFDDLEPSTYFENISKQIKQKNRWTINENGIHLGFFSFSKLLMHRDLDAKNWKKSDFTRNSLIKGLLAEGFQTEPEYIGENDNIDEKLAVKDIFHIIEADSSQTKVIAEVDSGKNLVVQGPPGTGKSQTITNILANEARKGKKILFVAEKMAALNVVHDRLKKVGLEDLCLELHSHKANKKAFLEALTTTLVNSSNNQKEVANIDNELTEVRDQLNQIDSTLHTKIPNKDYSAFDILSKLIRFNGLPVPRINYTESEEFALAKEIELSSLVNYYLKAKQGLHSYTNQNHPLKDINNTKLEPYEWEPLLSKTDDFEQSNTSLQEYLKKINILYKAEFNDEEIAEYIKSLEHFKDFPAVADEEFTIAYTNKDNKRFREGLSMIRTWQKTKIEVDAKVVDTIWGEDLNRIRLAIAKGVQSWISRLFGSYRSNCKQLQLSMKQLLPKTAKERLSLIDELISASKQKRAFEAEVTFLSEQFKTLWRAEKTEILPFFKSLVWLDNVPNILSAVSPDIILGIRIKKEEIKNINYSEYEKKSADLYKLEEFISDKLNLKNLSSISELSQILSQIKTCNYNEYQKWTQYLDSRKALAPYKVESYLSANDNNDIEDDNLLDQILYSIYIQLWGNCKKHQPSIEQIKKQNRDDIVSEFQELEKKKIEYSKNTILQQHLNNIPKGTIGEMRIINGELAKKRKVMPIRKLIINAGTAVQGIKSIFLMSPLSVAQYLPPEKIEFDILVIDEASQVKPEDALGAIARAKQIVVVGDKKQLPPTSFFDRAIDDEDEDEENNEEIVSSAKAQDMESILSLCEARGLNQYMLEWHYRSKDPSLIAISNKEFYDNKLILPPCPYKNDKFYELSFERVAGVYTRGKGVGRTSTNIIEAQEVVNYVAKLAKIEEYRQYSVGIVAFSKEQVNVIEELLEVKRRKNEVLNEFLSEDKNESIFIKNIENVQGDERDIILISVGYGPNEQNHRLPSMNFGPINREGGERRLNVLFTRAKFACKVFCSFDYGDIDLNRSKSEGVRILKRFLEFADTKHIADDIHSGEQPDSDFEEDVANEIRKMGYKVDYQVGSSGFKIDLGVKNDNDRYILAVECDGATYHSSLSARERDWHRQQILESFGWKFYRIWSTDWFYNKEIQIQKLSEVLKRSSELGINNSYQGTNFHPPVKIDNSEQSSLEHSTYLPKSNTITVPKYEVATIKYYKPNCEPHKCNLIDMANIIKEIVEQEGLVHKEIIATRYANFFNCSKVGERIFIAVKDGVRKAVNLFSFTQRKDFIGTTEQFENPIVRDRSDLESYDKAKKAEFIAEEEIKQCAEMIKKECGQVGNDELCKEVSKALGFKRCGPDLQTRIQKALKG